MMTDNIEKIVDECASCEIHYSDEEVTEEEKMLAYASEEEKQNFAKQNRFRSWALWVSVAGAVSVIFTALNVWEHIGITNDTFQAIVTAVGSILTAFGIVNNPTSKGEF